MNQFLKKKVKIVKNHYKKPLMFSRLLIMMIIKMKILLLIFRIILLNLNKTVLKQLILKQMKLLI